MASIAYEELSL